MKFKHEAISKILKVLKKCKFTAKTIELIVYEGNYMILKIKSRRKLCGEKEFKIIEDNINKVLKKIEYTVDLSASDELLFVEIHSVNFDSFIISDFIANASKKRFTIADFVV